MRALVHLLLLTLLLAVLPGCEWISGEEQETEPELPEWLSEEDTDEPLLSAPEASQQASLELRLHAGDRFPLRKVVEQELTQASLDGAPQVSRSRLELMLALTVEQIQEDRTKMQVRYDRIRYSHEVAGDVVEFDSAAPPQDVPPAALAYQGMIGDGFSFWIGPDNRIDGIEGFRDFLQRCLRFVPPEWRQQVMSDIEANSGETGIAEFIDQTIGLLPYDAHQSLGDTWQRSGDVQGPVPMRIDTVYTLENLTGRYAEISIAGTIAALSPLRRDAGPAGGVQITVSRGHSSGSCTIDLETGLPQESHLERVIDMAVQVEEGGFTFNQQKRTVTTVEALSPETVHSALDPLGPRYR